MIDPRSVIKEKRNKRFFLGRRETDQICLEMNLRLAHWVAFGFLPSPWESATLAKLHTWLINLPPVLCVPAVMVLDVFWFR